MVSVLPKKTRNLGFFGSLEGFCTKKAPTSEAPPWNQVHIKVDVQVDGEKAT